jgi:hypothetical protein
LASVVTAFIIASSSAGCVNWTNKVRFGPAPLMDLSLVLVLTIAADLVILKIIPARRRVARFVCMSIFFALQTILIVALIGSPLRPTFKPKDLTREFWLQVLTCVWWVLAARELSRFLRYPKRCARRR